MLDDTVLYKDPYGVVLVIGAWNYPIQLLLVPVVGAIAAGNCVVMKPSEVSAATAKLIAELIPKYLDQVLSIVKIMFKCLQLCRKLQSWENFFGGGGLVQEVKWRNGLKF